MHPRMNNDDAITSVGPAPAPIRTGVAWGAVFAGTLVAVGVWLLLHLLGMGVGLAAIEPNDIGSLRGVGIGTGVWTLLAPILALFAGGLAAGRLAAPAQRGVGAILGAIVWSLTTVLSVTLLWMALSAAIGGAVQAGGSVAAATASGGVQLTPEALGISSEDLLGPINRRLQAEGKPAVTSDQLVNATRAALRTSVREGRVDRELIIVSLSRTTDLTPEEAADVASSMQRRYEAGSAALAQDVRTGALTAADRTGKALLGLALAMALGLAAAIAGAALTVHYAQSRANRNVNRQRSV